MPPLARPQGKGFDLVWMASILHGPPGRGEGSGVGLRSTGPGARAATPCVRSGPSLHQVQSVAILAQAVSSLERMSELSRFSGTADSIRDALVPHVTSKGWLLYDEAAKVNDAKTDHDLIVKHEAIIHKLYQMQTNLAFTRSLLKDAMRLIFVEKEGQLRTQRRHA